MTISKRLIRTVPEAVDDEQEHLWEIACALHPDWEHITHRDPVDRDLFPMTSKHWDTCESGAQLADLIRAEDLYWRSGIYLDSDVEVLKPLDPLLNTKGFAGWEDENHICNAVMGFEAGHPALREYLELAIQRHGEGTWLAGVGAFTEVMRGRDDVLLLAPGSLYPVHYRQSMPPTGLVRLHNPWAYTIHHWNHSWASAEKIRSHNDMDRQ